MFVPLFCTATCFRRACCRMPLPSDFSSPIQNFRLYSPSARKRTSSYGLKCTLLNSHISSRPREGDGHIRASHFKEALCLC
jgi:hypothetical protein